MAMSALPESTKATEILAGIRADLPDYDLVPGQTRGASWSRELAKLNDRELLGADILDDDMASCVRSGLLLRADLLDESHSLSQDIHSSDGSYWHGIMHRREPDYSNSGYWFRKVGRHSVFEDLTVDAVTVASRSTVNEITGSGAWDPFAFIDLCESCHRRGRSELRADLLALQELEIDSLLAHCYRQAVGA
jgi:hypothetical protein